MQLRVRTHEKLCGLRAAICVLRPAAYFAAGRRTGPRNTGHSTGRSMQIAAFRQHGFLCVRKRNRVYLHTHAARNCWEEICAIRGNTEKELKYVQLGAAWGKVLTGLNFTDYFTEYYYLYMVYPYTWGPLPGDPGGPWTPQNKTGGSSNRFGPTRFFKKNSNFMLK